MIEVLVSIAILVMVAYMAVVTSVLLRLLQRREQIPPKKRAKKPGAGVVLGKEDETLIQQMEKYKGGVSNGLVS